jgi:superfamily II DNA or RNA helicase
MKQPYPYQEDIIKKSSVSLAQNKTIVVQSPTGSGKTIIMATMIHRGLKKGNTFLVISETRKIYKQLVNEFGGIEINASVKSLYIKPGNVYVGMAQTLRKRPMILEQFRRLGYGLIVLADEVHISTHCYVLNELSASYLVGFTATPFYKYAKHLPVIFKELVPGPQVDELIQLGKLCNYQHLARTKADLTLLEMRNGEYTEASQEEVFTSRSVYAGLFDDLRSVPFKKCIIFVASIKAAEDLNSKLVENGFASTCYHSQTPNSEYELAKFTELGLCDILVSIRSLSKGFDFPSIDLVILNHKTTSPALYLQEIGRGSRISPGKNDFFTVLDYGDNWREHGLYFEHRDFTTLWNTAPKKKKEKDGVSPVKSCPKCDSILASSVRVCKYCGEVFPIQEKELEIGDLVEITADYSQLAGKRISELSPYELSVYSKTLNKKPYGARVARAREQSAAGYLAQYASFMGYKSSWVDFQQRMISEEPIEFADLIIKGTFKAA